MSGGGKAFQAKHIPERPILEHLERFEGVWCNWCFGDERDVHNAMPTGIPDKVVLAKMRALMERGLVVGCGCGCRGDFEITMAGLEALAAMRCEAV